METSCIWRLCFGSEKQEMTDLEIAGHFEYYILSASPSKSFSELATRYSCHVKAPNLFE